MWKLIEPHEDTDNGTLFNNRWIVQEIGEYGYPDEHCAMYAFDSKERALTFGRRQISLGFRIAVYEEIACSIKEPE